MPPQQSRLTRSQCPQVNGQVEEIKGAPLCGPIAFSTHYFLSQTTAWSGFSINISSLFLRPHPKHSKPLGQFTLLKVAPMANLALLLASLCLLSNIFFLPFLAFAISSCGGPCQTLNDCEGQLICVSGKCNDDPDVGTHICQTPSPSPPSGSNCQASGTLTCGGISYPTYRCSPRVTSSTPAKLTNNDFSEGGDGGGASECDEQYHSNSESIVALSTGWYNGGSRCGKMIRITAQNGRSVVAKVVDECDSMRGCDQEHAYQPPCKNNIVDGSDAVWSALGLDKDIGVVECGCYLDHGLGTLALVLESCNHLINGVLYRASMPNYWLCCIDTLI